MPNPEDNEPPPRASPDEKVYEVGRLRFSRPASRADFDAFDEIMSRPGVEEPSEEDRL